MKLAGQAVILLTAAAAVQDINASAPPTTTTPTPLWADNAGGLVSLD